MVKHLANDWLAGILISYMLLCVFVCGRGRVCECVRGRVCECVRVLISLDFHGTTTRLIITLT